RGIVAVSADMVWRYPIGRAGNQRPVVNRVSSAAPCHTDEMLLGLRRLVTPDQVNHVVLPLDRAAVAFVTDLPKDVVEVVERVNHFPDVRFLQSGDLRVLQGMDFLPLA